MTDTPETTITLDEFILDQRAALDAFHRNWNALHRKNAEIYPLKMLPGDWSEQLNFWFEPHTKTND